MNFENLRFKPLPEGKEDKILRMSLSPNFVPHNLSSNHEDKDRKHWCEGEGPDQGREDLHNIEGRNTDLSLFCPPWESRNIYQHLLFNVQLTNKECDS